MKTIKTIIMTTMMALVAAQTVGPSVQVKDLRLFYGNDEWYIKGMAYSPSPLAKIIDHQTDGTGLCTPRRTYVLGSFTQTQTISPCFYDDYADGSVYSPGPTGGWWAGIWQRDFPALQALGVNTIRLYHSWPMTQQAIQSDPRYTDKSVIGTTYRPFLDLAQQYGLKVLFPLQGDQDEIDALPEDIIQYYIKCIIDEVGYHPAVLMYSFGNELQFTSRDATFVAKINRFLDYARTYQVQRWGRYLPVTTGLLDFVDSYNTLTAELDVDIIMANAGYRGFDFQSLWAQFRYLTCSSQKALLIGEMGVHKDSTQFDVPSWFPLMWSDLVKHKNYGAIGGFLFEWVDEHWKGVPTYGTDYTQFPDVFMGVYTMTPGSGQFPVDNIVPKSGGAYDYNSIKQGFSQNVYLVDGPNQLSNVRNNLCDGTYVSPIPDNSPPNAQCSPNLVACGGACIPTDIYCCVDKTILQIPQCPPQAFLNNPTGYFAGSPGGNPFPTTGASNPTPTTGNNNGGGQSTTTNNPTPTTSNNNGQCQSMFASLKCRTTSEDPTQVDVTGARGWLCSTYPQYCTQIQSGGQYSGCNAAEQMSYAMNLYYADRISEGTSACSFGGIGVVVTPSGQSTTTNNNGGQSTTTNNPTPTTSSNNNGQCQNMFASLTCRTKSEDPTQVDSGAVSGARSWLCGTYPQYCTQIQSGGQYSGCNSVEQISYAINSYYADHISEGSSACSFGGIGVVVTSSGGQSTTTNNNGQSTTNNNPTPTTSSNNNCQSMFASLKCRTKSEDPTQVDVTGARGWLCSTYPQYCTQIQSGGQYSGCNAAEQMSYAMNLYYADHISEGSSACNFGSIGVLVTPSSGQSTTTNNNPTPTTSSSNNACQAMFAASQCRTKSEDPTQVDSGAVSGARSWLCGNYPQYCTQIQSGGQYSSCNTVEQLSNAMSQYYAAFSSQGPSACGFGGLGNLYNTTSTSTPPTGNYNPNSANSGCTTMFSQLKCRTTTEDPSAISADKISGARSWLCSTYPQYCTQIQTGGQYSGCNSVEQLSYGMNLYYAAHVSEGASACSFGGIGQVY